MAKIKTLLTVAGVGIAFMAGYVFVRARAKHNEAMAASNEESATAVEPTVSGESEFVENDTLTTRIVTLGNNKMVQRLIVGGKLNSAEHFAYHRHDIDVEIAQFRSNNNKNQPGKLVGTEQEALDAIVSVEKALDMADSWVHQDGYSVDISTSSNVDSVTRHITVFNGVEIVATGSYSYIKNQDQEA